MAKRRRRKKQKNKILLVLVLIALIVTTGAILLFQKSNKFTIDDLKNTTIPEYIDVQILPIGESREGIELEGLNNIVIHYVGNPKTTAQQNRNYYENDGTTVNSHFIVGLDGEIIQCIPLYERSAASNHRNIDTISIEVCHPDESGEFTTKTKAALIRLCAWLCKTGKLEASDIIRHYDVTGKPCPIYYVENPKEWEKLINDIKFYINNESR